MSRRFATPANKPQVFYGFYKLFKRVSTRRYSYNHVPSGDDSKLNFLFIRAKFRRRKQEAGKFTKAKRNIDPVYLKLSPQLKGKHRRGATCFRRTRNKRRVFSKKNQMRIHVV